MKIDEFWKTRTKTTNLLRRPGKDLYISMGHKDWRSALADARSGQPNFTDEDAEADDWVEMTE